MVTVQIFVAFFKIVSKTNRMNNSLLTLTPKSSYLGVWLIHFKSCKHFKCELVCFFFWLTLLATNPLYSRNNQT